MSNWKILKGSCLETLRQLPANSVHVCITSPPYWGLRGYGGEKDMIGMEPTMQDHLSNIVAVGREIRRVLRDDGTLWLNYGDAYNNAGSRSQGSGLDGKIRGGQQDTKGNWAKVKEVYGDKRYELAKLGLPVKQRLMLPARVALALQDDGWWIRSEIIWAKGVSFCPSYSGSCMPSSVRDRPTDSHEMMYLLSKKPSYYYDQQAVREPSAESQNSKEDTGGGRSIRTVWMIPDDEWTEFQQFRAWKAANQGDLTDTWVLNPRPLEAAHFATYPERLVEPCIKAGSSEHGACSECGSPWERVIERVGGPPLDNRNAPCEVGRGDGDTRPRGSSLSGLYAEYGYATNVTTGWKATCDHPGAPVVPCVVLDPFNGSGTTGVVALQHGRNYIGCEINEDYIKLAKARLIDAPKAELTGALVFCPGCEAQGKTKLIATTVIENAKTSGRKITCMKCMKRYTYEELTNV